jgi:hypothetical protein
MISFLIWNRNQWLFFILNMLIRLRKLIIHFLIFSNADQSHPGRAAPLEKTDGRRSATGFGPLKGAFANSGYFIGRNAQPCQKVRMTFRVAGFEQAVPFHHGVFGQSDLPEHGDPLVFAYLALHCLTPWLLFLIIVTAMTMPPINCEPVVGSTAVFLLTFGSSPNHSDVPLCGLCGSARDCFLSTDGAKRPHHSTLDGRCWMFGKSEIPDRLSGSRISASLLPG